MGWIELFHTQALNQAECSGARPARRSPREQGPRHYRAAEPRAMRGRMQALCKAVGADFGVAEGARTRRWDRLVVRSIPVRSPLWRYPWRRRPEGAAPTASHRARTSRPWPRRWPGGGRPPRRREANCGTTGAAPAGPGKRGA